MGENPVIDNSIDTACAGNEALQEKISIIMIVYNVEKYLRQSIDSVLSQTYKNFELILSVSPGKDNCEAICNEYAAIDDRIKVVVSPPMGPSGARNAGLEAMTGDYLGFVDADDYIEPDMFESMLSNMHKYGADIAVTGRFYEYENATLKDPDAEPLAMTADEAMDMVLSGNGFFLHCWDKLFKRHIVKDLYFPPDVAVEDRVIVDALLGKADCIVYDSTPKYHFRERYGSLSKMRGMAMKNAIANDMLMEYVMKNHPAVKNQCERFMIYEYITAVQNILTSDDYSKDDYKYYCTRIRQIYAGAKGNPYFGRTIRIKTFLALYAPLILKIFTAYRKKKAADTYIRYE